MSARESNRMKTQEEVKNAPTTTGADASIVEPIEPVKKGDTQMKTRSTRMIIGVYILLALLGIGTGYLLSRATISGVSGISGIATTNKVVGSTDTTTFKDTAIGVIQKGGTDGEGTHQLIRDGGPSQTVTLMSSVVDLDQYVSKKVKVFGQTMAAQKAAWLMDVGRIELQ
jgi:hypothetical protein